MNQYTLDSVSADKKTFVFVTESIENIPSGYKARETYHIISDTEFIEIFEIENREKNINHIQKQDLSKSNHFGIQ